MVEPSNREIMNRSEENLSNGFGRQAHRTEQLAQQLSRDAISQWERALSGVLALPAAAALTTASSTLFVAAFIERTFEALQASAEAMGREIESHVRPHSRSSNGT